MPSRTATTTTKDANAPKKPLTAYMLFSAVERPKLKASGLDNFAEMSKALGAAWKQANTEIKTRYEKEHEREKARYDKELKEYQKTGAPAPSSKSAQKIHPPPKDKTTKSSTATTKSTSKKNTPVVKNEENHSDDEDEDDDDEEKEDDDDEEEESEEESEEEEKPAPPVKGSRKKI